jgi:hypothetical protein
VEWVGVLKKKYYAVRLKPTVKKLKVFTFRTANSVDAEEWYEVFKRGCAASVKAPVIH